VDSERPAEISQAERDRYSPARLSTFHQFPGTSLKAFMVASARGNILDADGTRNSLRSAKDATGVLITRKRRDLIIDELGIDPRRWRRLVDEWQRRQIAHRCSPGVVVLFTQPFLVECPACHQPTEATEILPRKARRRGKPFGEAGQLNPPGRVDSTLLRGADAPAQAAQMRPLSGTDSEHPSSGVAMRDEEGMEEQVAVQRPTEGFGEGSIESRRERESDAWPVPEGGYVSGWDIGEGGE
jgi:hypothetical protein